MSIFGNRAIHARDLLAAQSEVEKAHAEVEKAHAEAVTLRKTVAQLEYTIAGLRDTLGHVNSKPTLAAGGVIRKPYSQPKPRVFYTNTGDAGTPAATGAGDHWYRLDTDSLVMSHRIAERPGREGWRAADVVATTDEVASLREDLRLAQDEIASLRRRLSTANRDKDALNDKIGGLKRDNAALKDAQAQVERLQGLLANGWRNLGYNGVMGIPPRQGW